jgi:hypothetical protein
VIGPGLIIIKKTIELNNKTNFICLFFGHKILFKTGSSVIKIAHSIDIF